MDNPENFNQDTLSNFIHNPRKKVDFDGIHAELERRRKMQDPNRSTQTPQNESGEIMTHDSAVRQHLAEIVKALMAGGKIDQLELILKNHQTFINDILEMISKGKKKKK